jgi:hypothetical protein
LAVPQADAVAATVLVDELRAGGFPGRGERPDRWLLSHTSRPKTELELYHFRFWNDCGLRKQTPFPPSAFPGRIVAAGAFSGLTSSVFGGDEDAEERAA